MYSKVKSDKNEHVTYETFENGTVITWLCDDIIYVKAPNQFGTMWSKPYDTGVHNGAYGDDYIVRRGRKWFLRSVDRENPKAGMIWQEM